jgi:soluble lytic murein transglycosylase-like protein
MPSSRRLFTLLLCLATLASARTARAQIYSWRDASGHQVYSDRSPGAAPHRTFAVERTSVLATRPAMGGYRNDYDALIEEYANAYNVRADLVRAVIQVESGFNPRAKSPKGAMGLMQLMPATAAEFGVRSPFVPQQNIRGGVAYLRTLLDRYGEDETLALAAYNAGPTAVERYGNTVPPYRETQQYVDRVQTISPVTVAANVASGRRVLYKTVELKDGLMVPKYTDTRPASGPYEIIR